MVLDEISSQLVKRRSELVDLLENKAQNLHLEKQHQIYGAINEIDLFLQTLDFYQRTSNSVEPQQVNLARPPETKKGIFSRIFSGTKVSKNS
ncbi:MAG: hypothetical protein HGA85_04615 [Nanoarchaeota archaeon]|nr:hypothetical protein [Nanoarchaeota archaeon]